MLAFIERCLSSRGLYVLFLLTNNLLLAFALQKSPVNSSSDVVVDTIFTLNAFSAISVPIIYWRYKWSSREQLAHSILEFNIVFVFLILSLLPSCV